MLKSVRAKLLLLLAVLSLPLLVVSLVQLRDYRQHLDEQAAVTAHIETDAAAGSLSSWLESHPSYAKSAASIPAAEAQELHARLSRDAGSQVGTAIVVFDPQGHVLNNSAAQSPAPARVNSPAQTERVRWSDGATRLTGSRRIEPYGWSVAVGVPVAEETTAGRSVFMLTATWAVALLASTLLGVWAVGRFTKPLRKLAATASTLGGGQLHERVAVETDDEVGELAQNLNVMASQLETKFTELQTQGAFIGEVLDGLPLGLAVLDERLIVRKANSTFARFTGREAAALTGRGLYEAAAGLAVLSDIVEDVRRTRKPFVTYGLPLNLVAHAGGDAGEGSFWDVTIWPTSAQSAGRGDLILILSEVAKRVRAEKLATAAFASERTRAAELESII
ncbi:MAG TPA: HAMP domain-containing protein, partial [Pyrinomonadaceae bacterium]|nr:HAMP domain-containing protein [Pyrinomonadaceae bacterium]